MKIFFWIVNLLGQLLPALFYQLQEWWAKKEELARLNAFLEDLYDESKDLSLVTISDRLVELDLVAYTILLINEKKQHALLAMGKAGRTKNLYFIDLLYLELPFVLLTDRQLITPPVWWGNAHLKFRAAINCDKGVRDGSVHVWVYSDEKMVEHYRYVYEHSIVLDFSPLKAIVRLPEFKRLVEQSQE